MGLQTMGRPFDRHIDAQELDSLVPLFSKTGEELSRLCQEAVHEAERHLEVCEACTRKVSEYRSVMERLSHGVVSEAASPWPDCPQDHDVDWYEVAAGLWPESKANQLILHAALCEHCGPLLRAATSVADEATPEEEKLLAELKTPSRPAVKFGREPIPSDRLRPSVSRWFLQWKVLAPALALMIMVAVLGTR